MDHKPPISSTPPQRTLQVTDALSYLDSVKAHFSIRPAIYNKFLDIMKEFKSQSIDTPGVIDRVSTLFHGYPTLIQEFNTFLPPGYRIDCSPDSSNLITVTTPAGVTTRSTSDFSIQDQRPYTRPPTASPAPPPAPPVHIAPPQAQAPPPVPQQPASTSASIPANTVTAPPTAMPSQQQLAPPSPPAPEQVAIHDPKRTPLEFGHAISYVNRIKNRFTSDPDTYKTFLEILQNYQREQRPIQDVYAQVTALFHGEPDLLDEFKQFLPDSSSPENNVMYSAAATQPQPPPPPPPPPPAEPPYPDIAKPQSRRKTEQSGRPRGGQAKRKEPASSTTPAPTTVPPSDQPKKAKRAKISQPASPPPMMDMQPPMYQAPPPMPPPPAGVPQYPPAPFILPPRLYGLPSQTLTTTEEAGFFDLVKRQIEDRTQYNEFIKFIDLYSHGIIDMHLLLAKAYQFFGMNDELFAQFKELVGWDPSTDGLVEGEDWLIENENALDRPRFDMNQLKSYGPSYRRLPETEVNLACSGRDPLCWSVLNDKWVAFATWASEGAGSHRKNPFEDAMAACEQERHVYDNAIQSAIRTIAVLEPIAERISVMPAEEKSTFRLQAGFGHDGKTIYERVIKKLYNSEGNRGDHGSEVLTHLYNNPVTALPIVLNRLKAKTDEWRRNQREWNKVWREVDLKNHYRSLDHQALNFKANEKKSLLSKSFTHEIIKLLENRKQTTRVLLAADQTSFAQTRNQFEFSFADIDVLFDVLKLVLTYLDRVHGPYSRPERERVETCLRNVLHVVFCISEETIKEKLAPFEEAVAAAGAQSGDEDNSAPENENNNSNIGKTTQTNEVNGGGDNGDNESEAGSDAGSVLGTEESVPTTATSTPVNGGLGRNVSGKKGVEDLRRRLLSSVVEQDKRREESSSVGASGSSAATTSGAGGMMMGVAETPISSSDINGVDDSPSTSRGPSQAPSRAPSPPGSEAMKNKNTSPSRRQQMLRSTVIDSETAWINVDRDSFDKSSSSKRTRCSRRKANALKSPILDSESTKFTEPVKDDLDGRRHFNFFCNTSFYCLVRIIQILYMRLYKLKTKGTEMALDKRRRRLNPLAIELGLATPVAVIDDGENTSAHYYDHMLDMCERLFEQEIDQSTFEEHLRYMWGVEAYPMFTVDKVMSAIIKHIHAINGDSTSQYLLKIGKQDRLKGESMTVREQIAYRMQAETMIGPPSKYISNLGTNGANNSNSNSTNLNNMLYRVEWKPDTLTLSVQLMRARDTTMEKPQDAQKAWRQYLESYVLRTNTESIGVAGEDEEEDIDSADASMKKSTEKAPKVRAPFLHRDYRAADDEDYEHVVEDTDERVEMGKDYGISFGQGSGFWMVRDRTLNSDERERMLRERERRKERWATWTDGSSAPKAKTSDDDE